MCLVPLPSVSLARPLKMAMRRSFAMIKWPAWHCEEVVSFLVICDFLRSLMTTVLLFVSSNPFSSPQLPRRF